MGLFSKKVTVKPFNSLEYMKGTHMSGLPMPEGMTCNIYLHDDKIVFSDGTRMYSLVMQKIQDVTVKTETDIQEEYISNVGGAVGGAMLFGPLGAMIGGRARMKTTQTMSYFLIFTYIKDGSIDYISFDVTGWLPLARKIEAEVAKRIRRGPTVIVDL